MSGTRVPPNFDPYTQNITLLDKDGDSFTVSMRDFDMYRLYASRLAINYASQIGASLILLLVLLLLTRAEKRKSFIFIINAFSLASNTIRCILLCCYLTGNRYHPYSQISGDWSHVTRSDFAVAISSDILTLLVTALVFVSLILQIWVVCITTPAVQRNIIMATTSSVACVALGFKVALFFHNTRQLLAYQGMEACKTLIGVTYVLQGVALCLFSCVFTFKLGYAVVQRRRLNMPQFGPMQIVFIMGCQTMLVPAIFSTLQFDLSGQFPEFATQALTVVCIFLPLSAIWAGVKSNSSVAASGPNSAQHLLHGELYKSTSSTTSGSTGAMDKSRQMSVGTYGKHHDIESAATTPNKKSIHIDHEFGFSRDDAADRV